MIENIGVGSKIHESVEFLGDMSVKIGDHVEIGENVRFFGDGDLFIGDYSKIFRNCLFLVRDNMTWGEITWIAERCTIDSTGVLYAGNFVGVGVGSSLYSHIQHGDVTEGCQYDSRSPLIIGDDVWFVGQCLVSPGIMGEKSMAMLGSVITGNMHPNHVYGGVPAKDLTDKIGAPWKENSLDFKIARVTSLVSQGVEQMHLDREQFCVVEKLPHTPEAGVTYYSLSDRSYTKTNSPSEVRLNKWLFSSKAKFKAYE